MSGISAGDPGGIDGAAVVALVAAVEEGDVVAGRVDTVARAGECEDVGTRAEGAVAGSIEVVSRGADGCVGRVTAVEPAGVDSAARQAGLSAEVVVGVAGKSS